MASDSSFSRVMTKLRAGDEAAADEVFQRFVHRLIVLASRQFDARVRSKEDPEDVVNSVYKSFFRLDDRTPFELSNWEGLWALLATITVRKCIDRRLFWQADRRDVDREAAPNPEPGEQAWREAVDRGPTPDQAMVLVETIERLSRAVDPERRGILEDHLEGYSHIEIAERCGCSERTVGRVLSRVRDGLRRIELDEAGD